MFDGNENEELNDEGMSESCDGNDFVGNGSSDEYFEGRENESSNNDIEVRLYELLYQSCCYTCIAASLNLASFRCFYHFKNYINKRNRRKNENKNCPKLIQPVFC